MATLDNDTQEEEEEKQEEEEEQEEEQEQRERCLLYPVFCTANIPITVLNNFLATAHGKVEEESRNGSAFHLVRSLSKPSTPRASRSPTSPVEKTPFLHFTPEEIYSIFTQRICAPMDSINSIWAAFAFAILDERSITDGTCVIACNAEGPLEMIRADFEVALDQLVPCELMKHSMVEVGGGGYVGEEGRVLTAKAVEEWFEESDRKYAKMVAGGREMTFAGGAGPGESVERAWQE